MRETVFRNFGKGVFLVNISVLCGLAALNNNVSAADAHDSRKAESFAVLFGVKVHCVFVRQRERRRTGKDYVGLYRRERFDNGNIGFVPLARVGKRAVKINNVFVRLRIPCLEEPRSLVRTHGMGT